MGSLKRHSPQVPDGWRLALLGDVADVRKQQVKPLKRDLRPYVALEHIVSENGLNGYGRAGESISNKTLFRAGDTLYGKLRPNLKKVIRAEFDGVCSTDILAIYAREQTDRSFLSHLLRSDPLHLHAMQGVAGTKMPRTSWRHLLRFMFPLPPPPEQQDIAGVLDSIYEAIERTEAVIVAMERLRDALLHDLLTRGVPGWHSEWKEVSGIGTTPACWEAVRLGDVASVRNGTTPSRAKPDYWQEGDVPFVRTGRVNDVIIESSKEFITHKAVSLGGAVVVPEGSVLIAMIGQGKTRGMTARLKIDAAINQNFAAVYAATGCFSLDFFFTWAKQNYSGIRALGQGSNQDALNCELVEGVRVPRPPIDEQQTVAAVAESFDDATQRARDELNSLRELKVSVANALLTGRVRVTLRKGQGNG